MHFKTFFLLVLDANYHWLISFKRTYGLLNFGLLLLEFIQFSATRKFFSTYLSYIHFSHLNIVSDFIYFRYY